MKKICLILFINLSFSNIPALFGQKWEPVLAFPTAAELGSFGHTPVGLFTGTNQVSIPLYELKTKNLSYPVSLNYSSNGFKVDKISSRVGFDWTLSAEGVITRIIRGYPDDAWQFTPYPVNLNPNHTPTSEEYAAELDYYTYWRFYQDDSEPDMYSFNFCGYSGEFYIDEVNNKAILVPYQDCKYPFILRS